MVQPQRPGPCQVHQAFLRLKDEVQGRYNNASYEALAEELGFSVTHVVGIGWSDTALADGTPASYAAELAQLAAAIAANRDAEPTPLEWRRHSDRRAVAPLVEARAGPILQGATPNACATYSIVRTKPSAHQV